MARTATLSGKCALGGSTDPDFRRLCLAVAASQAGAVAVLATASALVLLVASFPAGYVAEFRRKRPVMITADLLRALVLGILLVLLVTGHVGFGLLLLGLSVNAALQILFASASAAHTKDLISPPLRADALGKLQAAVWISMIAGPAAAGVIGALTSAAVLLAGNAGAFVLSALLVHSIRRPEGPAPRRREGVGRGEEAISGVRFVLTQPLLRRIFGSWLIFAGAVAAMTPVSQVFYLRDLEFSPQQYGLLMGLPSVGGLLGAWMTGRAIRRFGVGPTIWWSSVLRSPWYVAFPLAAASSAGLLLLVVAFSAILFFSAITNSAMAALRMELTPDELMSRTSGAWMVGTMAAGPAFIPLVGLVAQSAGTRSALWVICALVILSLAVLPRRQLAPPDLSG